MSGEPGGMTGRYYKKNPWDDKNRLIERKDASINYDFGTKGPSDAAFDLWNFSVVWIGSIIAPETGEYEFIIQSNQNVKLQINGDRPILDNRVRSLNEVEFKASTYLIAGRNYPFFLEFSKQTAGVNDEEKKKKTPPSSAFVKLLWKRPKMAAEIIPPQFFSQGWNQNTYICETPLPADDRSIGYDRGNAVSKDWDEATTRAALETAEYVVKSIDKLSGTKPTDANRVAKLKEGAKLFLTKAFRQPLTPEQEQLYLEKPFATAPNPASSELSAEPRPATNPPISGTPKASNSPTKPDWWSLASTSPSVASSPTPPDSSSPLETLPKAKPSSSLSPTASKSAP
jgi:hypothetical protein